MKKKLMIMVLCTALFTSALSGCGTENNAESGTGTGTESNTENRAEDSSQSAVADSRKFDQPVKLSYLTWNYADRTKSTDAWIEGCKENFNIEIELQNTPSSNYEATFLTKFAAEDLPDLVSVHKITPDYLTDGGAQIDEATFVDISGMENVKNFSRSAINGVKIGEKLYYVPVAQNSLGVLYNKKVFTDNGLEIPKNIDEFMTLMDTLKEKDIIPLAGSFADAWTTQIIPFIAWDNYVGRKDPEAAKKLYDCATDKSTLRWVGLEGTEEAFGLTKKWVDEGYFTEEPMSTDASVASQLLATGEAAMFITGSWQFTVAAAACEEGVEIGFFPLPLNQPGEELYVPLTSVEGICISSKSKNVEAARIAMNYYLSQEIQQLVTNDLNGIATNQLVTMSPFANEVKGAVETNQVMFPSLYTKSCGYAIPSDATMYIGIQPEFQNILIGNITPEELCEKIDASIAEVAIIE